MNRNLSVAKHFPGYFVFLCMKTAINMKTYKENDSVIYTDKAGNRFDTFVIFDTDRETGLTHINHCNLKVATETLELHARSVNGCTMPMADSFSFELFKQLKEKFVNYDLRKQTRSLTLYHDVKVVDLFSKAS